MECVCAYMRGISHVSAKHSPNRTPSRMLYRWLPYYTCSLIYTWTTATFCSLLSWSILRIVHCNWHHQSVHSPLYGEISPCPGTCRPAHLAWDYCIPYSIVIPTVALWPFAELPVTSHLTWVLDEYYIICNRVSCHFVCTIKLGKKSLVHLLQKSSTTCSTNARRWFGFLVSLKGPLGILGVDRLNRRSFGHRQVSSSGDVGCLSIGLSFTRFAAS